MHNDFTPLDTKIRGLLRPDTISHNLIFIAMSFYIGDKQMHGKKKKLKERRKAR